MTLYVGKESVSWKLLKGNVKKGMEQQKEEQINKHTVQNADQKPQENYYDKMPKFGDKGPSK